MYIELLCIIKNLAILLWNPYTLMCFLSRELVKMVFFSDLKYEFGE